MNKGNRCEGCEEKHEPIKERMKIVRVSWLDNDKNVKTV